MSLDLSGYMDVFADEARDHLQSLNAALLEFEKDTSNIEQVNVMFRSAHTLKGMSATMGFNEVAELTHKMENLLSPIRTEDLKANEEIVDILFKCLDALQEMVEAHIGGEDHNIEIDELVNELIRLASGEAPSEDNGGGLVEETVQSGYPGELGPEENDAITSARNNGKEIYHIHIVLSGDCDLRNVRSFMVMKELKEIGDLIQASPSEKVLMEDPTIGFVFDLLYASTESPEDIENTIFSVLEIDKVRINIHDKEKSQAAQAASSRPLSEVFTFNEYDLTVIKQATSEGFRCIHVHVILDEGCQLKSARAFMVHKQLETLGEIIAIVPDVEDIEFEKFDRDIDFLVLSRKNGKDAHDALINISEIESIEIDDNPTIPGSGDQLKAAAEAEEPAEPAGEKPKDEAAKPGKAIEKKAAAAPKKAVEKPVEHARTSHTIRVDTERLDMLLNLVGELVIGKTRLDMLASNINNFELTDTIEQFDQIVSGLQNVVMQTRMVPIETVFNRFPRMVRDLAKQRDKQIDLVMTGGETELDRTVIDEIGDPLVHLIRNGLDHGIETREEREAAGKPSKGTLTLAAFHEGSNVFIEIRDDGAGIDHNKIRKSCVKKGILTEEQAAGLSKQEAIEMIFAAGLSTADQVTDISGRGVGMDAVKNKLELLSGTISVKTELGKGSVFTIKLPLTLAIVQALLVDIAKEVFAIPLAYIEETLRIKQSDIKKANQQDVVMLRGDILPLVWMRKLLNSPDEPQDDSWFVVVVRSGKERVGLCVDTTVKQTEIVIKSLGKFLQNTRYISGGTILGDGTVALILDVAHIATV